MPNHKRRSRPSWSTTRTRRQHPTLSSDKLAHRPRATRVRTPSSSIADGRRDLTGGELEKLHDGRLPSEADEPQENFFFRPGANGGRLLLDLGRLIPVRKVNTYSWHPGLRGPQVYRLYGSQGPAEGFTAQPKADVDPLTCGWTLVASVDTRPAQGEGGGQYGVCTFNPEGSIGEYRYLLFDISRTEDADPFGNTFYSEIDVLDSDAPQVAATPIARPGRETFFADGEKYRITIDTSETPDLTEWVRNELVPVVQQWYPRIVELLPSDGFEAPSSLRIVFRARMQGVAAAAGTNIYCGAGWFRQNLSGEAKGAVVHELVHVVQQYDRARRSRSDAAPTPGWVVEGIADYIRWYLYEPETRGAEITRRALPQVRYDGNYRVSANFIDWVTRNGDAELVRHLNAAARQGTYRDTLWHDRTGKSLQQLGEEW